MKTYTDPRLHQLIQQQLSQNGLQDIPLSPKQIFGLDQFHLGGPEPILDLLSSVAFAEKATILDLGCGFGGVARLVASHSSAQILGMDQDANYLHAAEELTRRCGLTDRIRFRQGDITTADFGENGFDGAFMAHVQMNIEDKSHLFSNIRKTLKPGAPFLFWEVFSETPDQLTYPLPWALDPEDSYLISAQMARSLLEDAGFKIMRWDDRTPWVQDWSENIRKKGFPPGPFLGGILPQGKERLGNMRKAVMSSAISVIAGVAYV